MKRKKAGVYDRWLHALGGGEQLAFVYAESLRNLGYETDLITHRKIDTKAAMKKMAIDLSGINIRYIPNLPDYQLSGYTEGYDIFVSNSYLDYIPNRSKFGILSIFFPSRINVSMYEYLKRAHIVPSLRRLFIYPSVFEGFKYDEYLNKTMYKWLGKESKITFNDNIKELKIELYVVFLAFSCVDEIKFFKGDDIIQNYNRKINIKTNRVSYTFKFNGNTKGESFRILLPDNEFSENIALTKIIIPGFRYTAYNLFKDLFPKLEMRLHGGPSITKLSDIESYDKIITISNFSKFWIRRYWKLSSNILYPPAAIDRLYPIKFKKNMIVHIGRFFIIGHCKKQLDMTRVFKKIVNKGWKNWELHFVGSIAEGEVNQIYYKKVVEESKGYPIFFHINASFEELRNILSEAKIYWHATGLDEDLEKNPIRFEHFGITTIEAMASGCVPVVINFGGQKEIVTKEVGYLWNSREELMTYTIELMKHNKLLQEKRKAAILRSKIFNKENFKKELQKYLPKNS